MQIFFFSWILCCILIFSNGNGETLEDDKKALIDFLTSSGSSSFLGWNLSLPVCDRWTGVTCSKDGARIVAVRLPGFGFNGWIPPFTISRLTSLKILSLRNNQFTGEFPSDFLNLKNLTHLFLQRNKLLGPLPRTISELKNLRVLDLSNNGFNGSIPSSVSGLTTLKSLNLANNSFSGEIPDFNLPNLKQLNLSNNKLVGTIPKSLQGFPSSSFSGNNISYTTQGGDHKIPFGLSQIVFLLIVAAVCIVIFSGLSCIMITFCLRKRCFGKVRRDSGKLEKIDSPSPGKWTSGNGDSEGKIIFSEGSENSFELDDLLSASAEVLGRSMLAMTYKVTMEDMSPVVVKRWKVIAVGKREFEQQMEIIGKIRHENVVELKAYYYSKDAKFVVYNYYSKGSLSAMLYENRGVYRVPLHWDARLKIAIGAARALAKIHEANNDKFVHGNIKSCNILIDSHCNGCIGDLGLTTITRSLPQTTCSASGYYAPEITDTRKCTQFSDIYSFGVVLLELLSGKSPASPEVPMTKDENMGLVKWIRSVVLEQWTGEVFDIELLSNPGYEEEMVEMMQIGLACVDLEPQKRPQMKDVVKMIENIRSNDSE